jgi:hypothetical protein
MASVTASDIRNNRALEAAGQNGELRDSNISDIQQWPAKDFVNVPRLAEAGVDEDSMSYLCYTKMQFKRTEKTASGQAVEVMRDGFNFFIGVDGNNDLVSIGVSGSTTGDRLFKELKDSIIDPNHPNHSDWKAVAKENWELANPQAVKMSKTTINKRPVNEDDQEVWVLQTDKLHARFPDLVFYRLTDKEGNDVNSGSLPIKLGLSGIDTKGHAAAVFSKLDKLF